MSHWDTEDLKDDSHKCVVHPSYSKDSHFFLASVLLMRSGVADGSYVGSELLVSVGMAVESGLSLKTCLLRISLLYDLFG